MKRLSSTWKFLHLHLGSLAAVAAAAFVALAPPAARAADDGRIAKLEREIAELEAARIPYSQAVETAGTAVRAVRDLWAKASALRDAHARSLGEIKSRLRQMDQQLAKLRSPAELADAWHAYKNNRTPEQFRKLWFTCRGTQPDQETMRDYDLYASQLQIEIRNKVAVPVAHALVKLGGLVKQIAEIAHGGLGGSHPRDVESAMGAVDDLAEGVSEMTERLMKYTRMSEGKAEKVAAALKATEPLRDLVDPQELLPEGMKRYVK